MGDPFPTLLPITPHTEAKHKILRMYLEAWIAIFVAAVKKDGERRTRNPVYRRVRRSWYLRNRRTRKSDYCDQCGARSQRRIAGAHSPVIHRNRKDRHRSLEHELSKLKPAIDQSDALSVAAAMCGDCSNELNRILDDYDASNRRFGPALVFLDQFGYFTSANEANRADSGAPAMRSVLVP